MGFEEATTYDHATRAEAIARLNDRLRTTARGGAIVITQGVSDLPNFALRSLIAALQSYSVFDTDNDPYSERDLGGLELLGVKLLWKIEYYDIRLEYGSPDPADPVVTKRILTVMLATEY